MPTKPQAIRKITKTNRNQGQALIEYALLIVVIISISLVLRTQMNKGLKKIWTTLAKDITAPCRNCTAPASITDTP